jgi:hypothetical protein
MPAPSNVSFATAIEIDAPGDYAQQVDDAGTTYTVFVTFVAAETGEMGAWGYGGAVGSGYRPYLEAYDAAEVLICTGDLNKPIHFSVTEGERYYLKAVKNGNTTPSNLALNTTFKAPAAAALVGSLLVNYDADGFPLTIASSHTDYDIIGHVNPFPNGEGGDILKSGRSLWQDSANGNFILFGPSFETLATVSFTYVGIDPTVRANILTNKFYIMSAGSGGTHARVTTVLPSGALGGTIWTLTGETAIIAGAPSNDDTIWYFSTSGSAIKTWDLVGNAAGADLVAAVPSIGIKEMLVLGDGTLLVLYKAGGGTPVYEVRRYSPSGTLLNTYDLSAQYNGSDGRIARALDDPTSFWAWTWLPGGSDGIARFINVRISDGSEISHVDHLNFQNGYYHAAETATPLGRFGISESCPFVIYRRATVEQDLSLPCCDTGCECDVPSGPSAGVPPTQGGSPSASPIPTSTGAVLPPVNMLAWTALCDGGGTVPTASDASDTESWVS